MNITALDEALTKIHERGAVHLPGWLEPDQAEHLAACCDVADLTPAQAELNGVPQHFQEATSLKSFDISLMVAALVEAVQTNTNQGRAGRASSLVQWQPQDWVYQVYGGGEGIGWHRDFKRAKLLIAVLNLRGTADFHVQRSSLDWVHSANWQLKPGDLVLMRGSGFQNVCFYGRPRHMVDNCSPGRASLTLRMMCPLD